jgi:glycosyltransferase involved in cell wall biosynthesis
MDPQMEGLTVLHDLSWDELAAEYCKHALFAMPAEWEPWGLVYLEAQAAGLPILGLARGAVPEFARDERGFVVPDATASAIAGTLRLAHSDPARLAAMGDACRRFGLAHTWDRTAETILKVLREEPSDAR